MVSAAIPSTARLIPAFACSGKTFQPLQCVRQATTPKTRADAPWFDPHTGDTVEKDELHEGRLAQRSHQLLGACEMYKKALSLRLSEEKTRACLTPFATCPISHDVMHTPVRGPDNHVYELSAIREHLKRSGISPLTRQPMHGEITFIRDRNMQHLSAFCDSSVEACTHGASRFVLYGAQPPQTMDRNAIPAAERRAPGQDFDRPFNCLMGVAAGTGIIAYGWPALVGLLTAGMVFGCGTANAPGFNDNNTLSTPAEAPPHVAISFWPGEPTAL